MPARQPCPSCQSRGRCRSDCERNRAREARDVTPADSTAIVTTTKLDKFRERLTRASDEEVAAALAACLGEVTSRRNRIADAARSRIAKLDGMLPRAITPEEPEFLDGVVTSVASVRLGEDVRARPVAATVNGTSHEEPAVARALQCLVSFHQNPEIKCTQAKSHEGAHFNRYSKDRW